MNKYTKKELLENFSNNVNFLLEKEKRSKQSFLNELGLSLSSFVNWTKQNSLPSADVVLQIASYFHVSPYDLVYKNNEDFQKEKENITTLNNDAKRVLKRTLKILEAQIERLE